MVNTYAHNSKAAKLHDAKTEKYLRNRQFRNNGWKLQYLAFNDA